jgi:hypothetical protein
LIAGVLLGNALKMPAPREITVEGVGAYAALALSAQDCAAVSSYAEDHLTSLQQTLGC